MIPIINKPTKFTNKTSTAIMKYVKKFQQFLNIIYENSMIPIINKPTGVTNKTATAIDHILVNSYTETILRCVVSDHFPICFIIPSVKFPK